MKYVDDLLFWVAERERIRIQRESGALPPYTADPILQMYRFCNVRREDDRVTRWIHNNWLQPQAHHPNVYFAMGLARMVNHPETLSEIGFPFGWQPEQFIETIAARKERGEKCWTSAYMITGGYSAGGEPKEVIIARVLDSLHHQLMSTATGVARSDSLEVIASKVTTPGIGSFLSGQIVADVKWLPKHRNTKDWWTWCTPGPGSTLGLNYMFDMPGRNWDPDDFIKQVWEVREVIRHAGIELDAQNTQNCLCEFSKYVRAKHFNKRLKTKYRP